MEQQHKHTPDQRLTLRQHFLDSHGWGNAACSVLAADASFRCYYRLEQHGQRRVLMDAPPPMENIRPFVQVARILHQAGLGAPALLAQDDDNGFLLLEDFGDNTFTRVLAKNPEAETDLYRLAVDTLIHLHRYWQTLPQKPALPSYDTALLVKELALYPDWTPDCPVVNSDAWLADWAEKLDALHTVPSVLVLRDYHVDNLMRLDNRSGVAACGLLDFQDAVLGHPAYDLVSLLWDARRDVPDLLQQEMLTYYCKQMQIADTARFINDYTLLGVQRTFKIIGIFHRLYRRDGKAQYLQHLPRLYELLEKTGHSDFI